MVAPFLIDHCVSHMIAYALQVVALVFATCTLIGCTVGTMRLGCSMGAFEQRASEVRTHSESSSSSSSDSVELNPSDTIQLYIDAHAAQ